MIDKEILKKIKLVVFDLDGTLVDDDNHIGEETKSLIQELSLMGIQFSIATGRLLSATTEHADALGILIPLITLDGTLIKRYPGETSIFESHLSEKHVIRSMKLADKYLLKIALCHDSAIYYTDENAILPGILEKFGAKYQKVNSYDNYIKETLEVVIVGDYHDTIKHVSNKMAFPYTYGVRTVFYKSQRSNYYLEIRKMGSSKGEGLKKLLRYLKIKEKETAVIGDWYNDKSLFETDALKVAVANAVPELKYLADFVTKRTNNEDGVAEFLKVLYKAKK